MTCAALFLYQRPLGISLNALPYHAHTDPTKAVKKQYRGAASLEKTFLFALAQTLNPHPKAAVLYNKRTGDLTSR